jgi:DNA-binding transcriptional ArsR family regulator
MADNNAALSKPELILHPVRLRILQAIAADGTTTQEIADRLADVPASSIYRHLKLLLDAGVVEVNGTRLVKGIQEKRYVVVQPPRLSPEDVAGLSPDEHFQYFSATVITLLRGFADYLQPVAEKGRPVDVAADRTGYTEVSVWASPTEMDRFVTALNSSLRPLLVNGPAAGRQKHKIAFITHPEK